MSHGTWVGLGVALTLCACSPPFTLASEELSAGAAGGAPNGVGVSVGGSDQVGAASAPSEQGGAAGSAGEQSVEAGGAPDVVIEVPGASGAPGGEVSSALRCPELGGERLVLAGDFCIDEVEVTALHYQAFVDDNPSPSAQIASCADNATFANHCKSSDPSKEPVRCVDWCDARAYCASVGKRLCGATSGGSLSYDAPAAARDSQWYSACSHAGTATYPYGDSYDDAACWGADKPLEGTLTVKSASGCTGGYAGLFDMSGGLAEWVDSCNADRGMSDACHIRGGAYTATADQLRCDWQSGAPRQTISNYIGFRCCADTLAP